MSMEMNLSSIDPDEASGEIKELYERVEELTGRVAPVWRVLAHDPGYMKIALQKFERLFGETTLDLKTKLFVYLAVSIVQSCPTCVYGFTTHLKKLGVTDEEFVELYSIIDVASGMNRVVNGAGITPEILKSAIEEAGEKR